jgi:hypothetical protein
MWSANPSLVLFFEPFLVPSQSEINDLNSHYLIPCQQYILTLQVTVKQLLRMNIGHGRCYLKGNPIYIMIF